MEIKKSPHEKCGVWGCENPPHYCSDHYHLTKEKLQNRNHQFILFIVLVLLGISLIKFFTIPSVDENKFCLDKLNTHFSEYNFQSAEYKLLSEGEKYNYYCVGNYFQIPLLSRDGLTEKSELISKSFKLTDKNNMDYLDSDDFKIGFGLLSAFCIFVIFLIIKDWKS